MYVQGFQSVHILTTTIIFKMCYYTPVFGHVGVKS